jgi:L-ascorbate metabolism protein UlaG (beta-lactamase superfamily)
VREIAVKFTWIGGATFLLELGAFRILGDPVFGESFEMAPHGKVTRVAAAPDVDVSGVDVVCASCLRPDHLERGVAARLGANVPLVSPPSVGGDHGFGDIRMLVHWASCGFTRGGETLDVHATPCGDGNGYFFRHTSGEKTTSVFWTGDALWSDDIRRVQRDYGYSNLLILHIGDEASADGGAWTPGGKEAMQIVYRMQPNAIAAIHHNTFSHYR